MPDFDWNASDRDTHIIDGQAPVAIYYNQRGQIVIRQQQHDLYANDDEDVIILISPPFVPKIIAALNDLIKDQ